MSAWKRNAVIAVIGFIVGVAVCLCWFHGRETAQVSGGNSQPSAKPSADTSADSNPSESQPQESGAVSTGYFATARRNRQQARDSALELLQQVIMDENASQDAIDEAEAAIQVLAALTLSEAKVENLITAKGYGDCVCFISDNSASVVVSFTGNGLSESDVTKIVEIVKEETGLPANRITVIETEP